MPKGLVDLVGVNDNRDDDKKVEKIIVRFD